MTECVKCSDYHWDDITIWRCANPDCGYLHPDTNGDERENKISAEFFESYQALVAENTKLKAKLITVDDVKPHREMDILNAPESEAHFYMGFNAALDEIRKAIESTEQDN